MARVFPVRGGSYTNDWGAARATTGSHKGTDIFAEKGTPVLAIEDGRITKMGDSKIGGLRIWISGRWYFAHLSGFAKGLKVGQRVKAGQVIGYVGNTGDAKGTPPHLHLGYSPDQSQGSSWANPFPILQQLEGQPALEAPPADAPVSVDAPPPAVDGDTPPSFSFPQGPSPPGAPVPGIALSMPGDFSVPYEPEEIEETWRLLAADPFASPETRQLAGRLK